MPLVKSGFIPIPPGAKPGFDHADVYQDGAGSSRIYVAHIGADRVDVIDCSTGSWLRALPGHPGVAGVLIDADADLLFNSDRAAGRVSLYRCSNENRLGVVDVGAHPNGLAFDPRRRRLFSFNLGEPLGEDCTASVVDLGRLRVVATIDLPGRPRWAVYDPVTDQVYVNIRQPAQILAIGARSLDVTGAFDTPAAGPHGLMIDGNRLFCAARWADPSRAKPRHRRRSGVAGSAWSPRRDHARPGLAAPVRRDRGPGCHAAVYQDGP